MARAVGRSRGELYFGVDARHIQQLGQELVGDRTTALTELIKNAYDADATHVALRFSRATSREGGVLEVEDDGIGMALADIERGWMRISTNAKDIEDRSPRYGRARAGRKGIGRFATETLGRTLTLRSTVVGEPSALVIEFDWENGYLAGRELADVGNPFRLEPAAEDDHGTVLRIEGLYDIWDDTPRKRIRRAVRLLQPPFPVAPVRARKRARVDPGFRVDIEVDGEPDDLVLPGYDDFLEAGTARLQATVSASGLVTVHVASDHLGLDEKDVLPDRYRTTGAFSLEASYFVFRSDALGGVGVRVAQQMANEFAGIRLYRDGLRVMPYGERDNDWLGLDQMQGARITLVPVANLNWFGQISISRLTNPTLRDTASREGLVDNKAFEQLRRAVRGVLVWGATRVGEVRQRKVTTSYKRPELTRSEMLSAARVEVERTVREELPASVAERVLPVISYAFDPISDQAGASDRADQLRIEELLDDRELLRVLASLGTSIAVFSHEVRSALTTSSAALVALAQAKTGAAKRLAEAREATHDLQDLAGYIDAYVSASQRRTREPQPLATVITDFRDRLSHNLARGVDFDTAVAPRALRTAPMARSELEAILINLLTNAIKAMDGEGHPERRVSITATGDSDDVLLRFQDTGAGIDPAIQDRIFDAFVSDTRSAVSELGMGTGLGLKIVRDIVEANGGSARIGESDAAYATCMEVRLPRWRKQRAGRS